MTLFILLLIPFVTGLVLHGTGTRGSLSWLLSTFTLPALVLFDEVFLPYRGVGAAKLPMALGFGALYGMILGGLGVLAAIFYLKVR